MRGKVDGLEAMSILLTVVETGSRSAAGRRPGTPLAVASRKVCDLEARLKTGVQFNPTQPSRHFALTASGRSYVEACKRILRLSFWAANSPLASALCHTAAWTQPGSVRCALRGAGARPILRRVACPGALPNLVPMTALQSKYWRSLGDFRRAS